MQAASSGIDLAISLVVELAYGTQPHLVITVASRQSKAECLCVRLQLAMAHPRLRAGMNAAHASWLPAQVGSSCQCCEGCQEDVCQTAALLPQPGVGFMVARLPPCPLLHWMSVRSHRFVTQYAFLLHRTAVCFCSGCACACLPSPASGLLLSHAYHLPPLSQPHTRLNSACRARLGETAQLPPWPTTPWAAAAPRRATSSPCAACRHACSEVSPVPAGRVAAEEPPEACQLASHLLCCEGGQEKLRSLVAGWDAALQLPTGLAACRAPGCCRSRACSGTVVSSIPG